MAAAKRLICGSGEVVERGRGIRFSAPTGAGEAPAFLVRYHGTVHAYINRCAHAWVELDWDNGQFFDVSGLYLVCSTHGAAYLPDTGECVGGPCKGQKLVKLQVEESSDGIYLVSERSGTHG